MITAAVGTYIYGFDELLEAVDQALAQLGLTGFAQSGHSSYSPRNIECRAFLSQEELKARLEASRVLICHAGMGLIGDGLRSGCRIIIFPRRGATGRHNPANDQREFAKAISARLNLGLCLSPIEMPTLIKSALSMDRPSPACPASNIPHMLASHLATSA